MKEILKKNRSCVILYLVIGLFNAFMSNYKADYFQKIVDGLTDSTITVYGILFYGVILFVNYGMNYLDEYPAAKLGKDTQLLPMLASLNNGVDTRIGEKGTCLSGLIVK